MDACSVIILAGSIKPSSLRVEVGMPVPCLPIAPKETLLARWLGRISALSGCNAVRVVVNSDEEADILTKAAARDRRAADFSSSEVVVEPSSWRGTAGILRDVSREFDPASVLLVVEASMVPPQSLSPLLDPLDDVLMGVVGASHEDEPNGTYAFRHEVLELVPHIGYFDLKEQFLPRLQRKGLRVRAAKFDEPVRRIRDRRTYLHAVHDASDEASDAAPMISQDAEVHETAQLAGINLIEDEVIVRADAVVHDSVLLHGAIVEEGAVVSRSIVGPGTTVRKNVRHIRSIVSNAPRMETVSLGESRRRRA